MWDRAFAWAPALVCTWRLEHYAFGGAPGCVLAPRRSRTHSRPSMGKGGRGGKAKAVESDDALLDAAIAENAKLRQQQASEAKSTTSSSGGIGMGGRREGEGVPCATHTIILTRSSPQAQVCVDAHKMHTCILQDLTSRGLIFAACICMCSNFHVYGSTVPRQNT